ncbi:uncharacterized protein EV154DRAFT_570337 [Mucor mucedo]|uniref:uncharacterized protein n=1 Tax=Mucor mucedo TaxID=29922 RepID=UPI002220B357|nr:uncharacterized protein EV154DRAFT_570337 [Mucor mucedo]KAI7873164.1 hypothetical protein EV154DRAFT_570337 [Mucor mucedo]
MVLSSNDLLLSFEVHKPKEKRDRRSIIKSFSVKAHVNSNLCPIKTFKAFRERRPSCEAVSVFINSIQPDRPIKIRTIQAWMSRLLHKSTKEKRVSVRSVASSLALQSGIPKEDIVTMGNWASSSTFENHYRREQLSEFDFTNTLINDKDIEMESDEDIFMDASDSFMDSLD